MDPPALRPRAVTTGVPKAPLSTPGQPAECRPRASREPADHTRQPANKATKALPKPPGSQRRPNASRQGRRTGNDRQPEQMIRLLIFLLISLELRNATPSPQLAFPAFCSLCSADYAENILPKGSQNPLYLFSPLSFKTFRKKMSKVSKKPKINLLASGINN